MAALACLTSAGPLSAAPQGYAALPPQVGTWLAYDLDGEPLAHARHQSKSLPWSGKTLHRVKAVSSKDGRVITAAYDGVGAPQGDSGRKLLKAERQARWNVRGGIRDSLWAKMQGAPAKVPIDVMLWLRAYEPKIDKEDVLGNDLLRAEHEAAVSYGIQQAQQSLLVQWAQFASSPVVFSSRAPVAFASLTPAEIWSLAKHPIVVRIYHKAPSFPGGSNWVGTIGATGTGEDGSAVDSCVLEGGRPKITTNLTGIPSSGGYFCSAADPSTHAQLVTAIIRWNNGSSDVGTAPGATTFIGCWDGQSCGATGYMSYAHEWCADTAAADVWNWSRTSPDQIEDLQDYWATHTPFPTIAACGGNVSNGCRATGGDNKGTWSRAYNNLSVGWTNDQDTTDRSDDAISAGSCWENPPGTDRELPHLVAPGAFITADGIIGSGCSFATPMVSGAALQVYDKNTSLNGWNEAVRAILMCAADENISGNRLDLADATDDKDGVGELNIGYAVNLADSSNRLPGFSTPAPLGYDYGTLHDYDFDEYDYYKEVYNAKTVRNDYRLRVVLLWNASVTCDPDPTPSSNCDDAVLDGDFDLRVWDDTDEEWKASSLTYDSAFEFVEFDAEADHLYKIYIKSAGWASGIDRTYFAVAWQFRKFAQ